MPRRRGPTGLVPALGMPAAVACGTPESEPAAGSSTGENETPALVHVYTS